MVKVPQIVFIGGGGHARVLLDSIRSMGDERSIGFVVAEPEQVGSLVLDTEVIGTDASLRELARDGCKYFVVALGGTRDNRPRARLFDMALSLGMRPLTIVHPTATVSKWASLDDGCQILPGAVVNAGARLSANTIVNSSAVVEHDCTIGAHAHISTGARLAGGVSVGAYAHVGIGATIRQSISIGEGAVVGAGAVVVKDVAADAVVAGVPAKEMS